MTVVCCSTSRIVQKCALQSPGWRKLHEPQCSRASSSMQAARRRACKKWVAALWCQTEWVLRIKRPVIHQCRQPAELAHLPSGHRRVSLHRGHGACCRPNGENGGGMPGQGRIDGRRHRRELTERGAADTGTRCRRQRHRRPWRSRKWMMRTRGNHPRPRWCCSGQRSSGADSGRQRQADGACACAGVCRRS